jgi:DDE superfamily endonuclease
MSWSWRCVSDGFPGSRSALGRFLDRHDIAVKKNLRAAEQHRADVARARRRWVRQQAFLDTTRLVFLDKTATTTNMVRLRGPCPRGVRLISHVPQGPWKTMTFVAALRHNKMVAPMVVDGPMNGEIFLAYVEQCLAATLKRNDVGVMGNPPAHKVPGACRTRLRRLVQWCGICRSTRRPLTRLKCLSASKLSERTIRGLVQADRLVRANHWLRQCRNYFRHAGYASISSESALIFRARPC